jgi:ketosteroid isomerase-like protein
MHESAPDVFLSALSARDFGRFAESLAPDAHARMLLPPGPEVRSGREEIARRFEGWFSLATDFEVLDSGRVAVGRRNRLNWRFRLSRDGQSHEVIEQVAFVNVGPNGISDIDLLCSGFLREEDVVASSAGPAGRKQPSIMAELSAPLEAVTP